MLIEAVTVFPEYFEPLRLSLIGKAIESGLIDVRIHDLRDFTHDRHRTVDDTPYGGGAGMVMKPEPWGEVLDDIASRVQTIELQPQPTLIFTTPAGTPFAQSAADELATHEHIVFACGRYEGIDQRVIEWARAHFDVREYSLGDYVLNGGEVAALAMSEAIVRLIPGVIGNPESLIEESHAATSDGLLEYPVYTKPATWRGLDVPEVLLSGHHGEVAKWRRARSEALTAERRPDLLP
ncbi:MAG: tRNA (guanosine(37)-N1)-methyltransferase TrmD [Propionibacteriaceae bacterium]|jgi:tRNA (guanine37-N1)-methyltransferase|nr:tRNA (guanosine(37)-N1)-methyltransferase TrmD [Propionibacteriaceae bacterium]